MVLTVFATLLHRISVLERQLYGRKSEKISRPTKDPTAPRKRATHQKRRIHDDSLPEFVVPLPVGEEQKECTLCGGQEFSTIGFDESFDIEYVPGKLIRRKYLREKCICANGCTIVQAPAPSRVGDSSGYGPALHAHVVVSRCLDAIPIHRQASQLARVGCAIAPHVLNALFHRVANELAPLYRRMQELLPLQSYINADETPQPVLAQSRTHCGYMWTFVTGEFALYQFSPTRSGETPNRLLKGSKGILQVDGYSGYNAVTTVDSRARAGCMAHTRRKFFDAAKTSPDLSAQAMEFIHRLYRIEQRAQAEEIVGTEDHHQLRQTEAKPILLEEFRPWLEAQQAAERPKSPIGAAIRYALNQWDALLLYLDHPQVRIDNNIAELRLRVVALGRKNSLFVGSNEGGQNLAITMSLVTTAHVNGLDPVAYITDALIRIQDPGTQLDDLLPHLYRPPESASEG